MMLNWKLLGILVLCLCARGELGRGQEYIWEGGYGHSQEDPPLVRVTTKKGRGEIEAQGWKGFWELRGRVQGM
jgi:hypothetical protein